MNNDVSIMIELSHHGKGIGTTAIKLVEIEAKKLGINYLVGKMMIFNKYLYVRYLLLMFKFIDSSTTMSS